MGRSNWPGEASRISKRFLYSLGTFGLTPHPGYVWTEHWRAQVAVNHPLWLWRFDSVSTHAQDHSLGSRVILWHKT